MEYTSNSYRRTRRMSSTCNRLDMQTHGSQPIMHAQKSPPSLLRSRPIMPQNLPRHCSKRHSSHGSCMFAVIVAICPEESQISNFKRVGNHSLLFLEYMPRKVRMTGGQLLRARAGPCGHRSSAYVSYICGPSKQANKQAIISTT